MKVSRYIALFLIGVFAETAFSQTADFIQMLDYQLDLIQKGQLEVNPALTVIAESKTKTQIYENQRLERDNYKRSTGETYDPTRRPSGEAGKRWDKTTKYLRESDEELKALSSSSGNPVQRMSSSLDTSLPSTKASEASELSEAVIKKINYVIQSAKNGNKNAQFLLALWYANGTNPVIEQDMEESTKWMGEAAKKWHRQACAYYGWQLYRGEYVEQDTELAIKFLSRGANGPEREAANDANYYLGMLYYEEEDMQECIKYLRRANGHRKAQALFCRGTIYLEGKGDIDQDFAGAAKLFYFAALDNNSYSGAKKAKSDAITILKELARRGVEDAKVNLKYLGLGY